MNRLLKTGLAVVGAAFAAGALRNAFGSGREYAPWERPPYGEFPNKVLVVGGGFAGYTAAKNLCELTKDRDDVGVLDGTFGERVKYRKADTSGQRCATPTIWRRGV